MAHKSKSPRLAETTLRASAWTISSGLLTRFLGLVGTLAVTYFIAPYDYGEVIAASVVVLTANQLANLSIGTYILAHRPDEPGAMLSAAALHLTLGLLIVPLVLVAGPHLSSALDAPTVARYLPGLLGAVLIERLVYVPERILVRDMRFGALSVARSAGEVAFSTISILAAVKGWGGAAIVAGNLARSGLRLVLMLYYSGLSPFRGPLRIHLPMWGHMIKFGVPVSVGALATFSLRRWDNLAVSHFFGPAVMATYALAYNIADIPAVQVGEQVSDVLQAAFSRAKGTGRKQALLRSFGALNLVMTPLAIGLACVAPTLVSMLDRRWAGASQMLMLLAAISLVRPTADTIGSYLQIRQRERLVALRDLLTVGLMMGALWTIGRTSPSWACVAVGLAFVGRLFLSAGLMRIVEGTPLRVVLLPVVRPILACVPMAAVVAGVHWGVSFALAPPVALAAEITAGAIAYSIGAWLFARRQAQDVLALLKHITGKYSVMGPRRQAPV